MMLDVDFVELRQGMLHYLPVGGAVGLIVLGELVLVLATWPMSAAALQVAAAPSPAGVSNTEAIGRILYTQYVYYFQAAGLVLLVAMIGAIVLTLRHKEGVKRQDIAKQVARRPATAIEVRKVRPGQGI
jgi:NADH-quinone oxidoreductase subunit J